MKRAGRAQLEAAQRRQLHALLRALVPGNRFYAPKLAAAGFTPRRNEPLADTLRRLPFTTKAELVAAQNARPPYGTNHTFPLSHYTRFHQTSGTTGTPLRCLDRPADWNAMVETRATIFRAAGITGAKGDRVFFPFTFGPFLGLWLAFEAAEKLGCLCISGGGLSSAARLRTLLDNGATAMCCTPTYALRLGEAAREENIPLTGAKLRTIFVVGEPGGSIPAVRERISRLWHGARVLDNHGMTEVGPLTYTTSRRPDTLVLMEDAYIGEVLDPVTQEEVPVGATGELVITTLRRLGSPVVRYRTSDVVRKTYVNGALAFEGGILGRLDDMVIVRGVNLYPSSVERVVRTFADVHEYRVEVRSERAMAEVALQIEPVPTCADPAKLAARVATALETAFALRIPVAPVPRGTLPQFEMKAKRWVAAKPAADPIPAAR